MERFDVFVSTMQTSVSGCCTPGPDGAERLSTTSAPIGAARKKCSDECFSTQASALERCEDFRSSSVERKRC
jgi:hypothetical protein